MNFLRGANELLTVVLRRGSPLPRCGRLRCVRPRRRRGNRSRGRVDRHLGVLRGEGPREAAGRLIGRVRREHHAGRCRRDAGNRVEAGKPVHPGAGGTGRVQVDRNQVRPAPPLQAADHRRQRRNQGTLPQPGESRLPRTRFLKTRTALYFPLLVVAAPRLFLLPLLLFHGTGGGALISTLLDASYDDSRRASLACEHYDQDTP
mmetsp:Transcript_4373/g.10710  ORF Transcript_4373/g.10710 Transcript_4373/m.10710 type:complete len:204 (-) Transcript_4373:548-1159(-)